LPPGHAVLAAVLAPAGFILGSFLVLSYKGVQGWIRGR